MLSLWIGTLCVLLASTVLQTRAQHTALVFEGGGVRGIAYAGALHVLDSAGTLRNIERVAGTSVGGLTAALVAAGYTPEEISRLLTDLDIGRFNDGRWLFAGGLHRTARRYGWYRGERFEDWVADLIRAKTGNADLTLGELHIRHQKDASYKDLYLCGTDLTAQRVAILSHETEPDMPVHRAVRISMSIPLYFGAVFLDSAGRAVRRPKRGARYRVLVDGGMAANYPITLFDTADQPSPRTLGLKLERPEQIAFGPSDLVGVAPFEVRNFPSYIGALYNFNIETLNGATARTEPGRTVYISTEGIGPRVRKMSNADVERLLESGRQGARRFLESKKAEQ